MDKIIERVLTGDMAGEVIEYLPKNHPKLKEAQFFDMSGFKIIDGGHFGTAKIAGEIYEVLCLAAFEKAPVVFLKERKLIIFLSKEIEPEWFGKDIEV